MWFEVVILVILAYAVPIGDLLHLTRFGSRASGCRDRPETISPLPVTGRGSLIIGFYLGIVLRHKADGMQPAEREAETQPSVTGQPELERARRTGARPPRLPLPRDTVDARDVREREHAGAGKRGDVEVETEIRDRNAMGGSERELEGLDGRIRIENGTE